MIHLNDSRDEETKLGVSLQGISRLVRRPKSLSYILRELEAWLLGGGIVGSSFCPRLARVLHHRETLGDIRSRSPPYHVHVVECISAI